MQATTLGGDVLLSNDDGPLSPLLPAFITALAGQIDPPHLHLAIPSEERSWISQAASLRTSVHTRAFTCGAANGMLYSGTPADCVTLAIQNVLDVKPTVCLSGINMGTNAGMAFYYNSGTLGAARQAVLCGIPALALSAYLPSEIFAAWRSGEPKQLESLETHWQRIATLGVAVSEHVLTHANCTSADFYSINLPWRVSGTSPVLVTRLARIGYQKLFQQVKTGYYQLQPSIASLTEESLPASSYYAQLPSDLEAIRQQAISVTPIFLDGQPPEIEAFHALQEALATKEL